MATSQTAHTERDTALIDVNYTYFVHFVRSLPASEQLKVLDFGCGTGDVVRLLREAGIEGMGCDVFYEAGDTHHGAKAAQIQRLMDAGWIQAIDEESDLPYPPQSFDVILANQVFEHVRDMDGTLRRLHRVLKDDGLMCFHFPLQEGLREGHIGIPFAHWFPRTSPWRRRYTLAMRRLGFGHFKAGRTPEEWTDFHLDWIDRYCHYRTYREVRRVVDPTYLIDHNEMQYIRYRARRRPLIRAIVNIPGFGRLWSALFRRLGSVILILRKRSQTA